MIWILTKIIDVEYEYYDTYSVYFTYFNLKQTKHYQSNQLAIRYLNKIDWIPVNDFILYILKEKKTF